MESQGAYPAPLDALPTLGSTGLGHRQWRDYAPLHAWRALGLLRVREAAAPLAAMMVRYEDDYARQDLPRVLGMIGEAAVEPVRVILANPAAALFTRVAAACALGEIAERHPGERDRTVDLLTEQLRGWPEQDATLNAFLIDSLVELSATDAAPLMEAAFEAHAVDESVRGDWEDVQVALGLLEERLTPRPPPWWSRMVGDRATPPAPGAQRPSRAGKAARKTKNRRAAAKQARKRNRGR